MIRGKEKLLIETNTTIPQLKILRTPSRSLGIISENSSLKLFGFKEPRIGLNKLYIYIYIYNQKESKLQQRGAVQGALGAEA